MKESLNQKVVSAIYESLPEKERIIPFLCDLLDLSRESAYRRVRNSIPFTFEEVAAISIKLGISADDIIGQHNNKRAFFDLYLNGTSDPIESYGKLLQNMADISQKLRKANESEMIASSSRIPFAFSMQYENIRKFRYFKWIHQTHEVPINFYLSDLTFPSQLETLYKNYMYNYMRVNNIKFILDKNTFLPTTEEVLYYHKRKLINDNEFLAIQKELLLVVDGIEQLLQTGVNEAGSNIYIYLSALPIESNCAYLEYDGTTCARYWSYTFNPIVVFNKEACTLQKKWLESLLKYSTLITKSNEYLQAEFLNAQRKFITDMTESEV
ncbi:helix-turn-helix domain-containing protein [uncultured Dysgonomonas sp.]|uniref:Transcription regulator BetR N-terminal domain-containing protein n=1 Tax=uncultured Dysgonomonas sp. TaxID=206096 RepID=A0A212JSG6_9BACT|nr:helix-turn-helix domain-containing protein [uncultured Dysgonomonas sp.]SBW02288.1 conserved hypothetical protein [uncultured Dysgonomonas sp.]